VRYVGTFDFGLHGFAGAYHSVCLGALPEGRDRPVRLAVNGADSQSGWAAAQDDPALTPETQIVLTGAHAASARAVAEGRADIAYLDAVTWRLLAQSTPEIARLPVRHTTPPTPGLPLITARDRDPAPLRAVLTAAFAGAAWRGAPALAGLAGFHVLPEADYLTLPLPPALPKPSGF
jgi:hypothetical protein